MRERLRKWWPVLKALLAAAIVVAIGRRFWLDLHSNPDLWKLSLHPGWLTLSGTLYLAGLLFSAYYWVRLLREFGQAPRFPAAIRAYYVGMMGKYLPGKAWALIFRATMMQGPGVRVGIATMTAFYEVLTTMTAGVLLAAVLFAFCAPHTTEHLQWDLLRQLVRLESPASPMLDRNALVLLALGLAAGVGLPLAPPIFNRIVHRVSLPFRDASTEAPRVQWRSLLEGLLLTSICWWGMGASLWAALANVMDPPPVLTVALLARLTAYMAVAYVAGFVILVVPSGLGVREFFLTLFLVPELNADLGAGHGDARALAIVAVLLLRLVWTVAEVILTGIIYWLPGQYQSHEPLTS